MSESFTLIAPIDSMACNMVIHSGTGLVLILNIRQRILYTCMLFIAEILSRKITSLLKNCIIPANVVKLAYSFATFTDATLLDMIRLMNVQLQWMYAFTCPKTRILS